MEIPRNPSPLLLPVKRQRRKTKIVCPAIIALIFSSAGFSQNYTIQTFAGGGVPQNVQAASASLGDVSGVAVDRAGNVYIALQSYPAIVRVSATTGTLTLVAGNGKPGFSGDNGPATNAQLNHPSGAAVDAAGNVYIADEWNGRIRKVSNGVITTVTVDAGPDGLDPVAVTVDSFGNLFIAGNGVVRKVSNGITTTVAGTGDILLNGSSGPATSINLSPTGVAVDAAGNLYIADAFNNRICQVSNGNLTTVAQLLGAHTLAVDATGNVYTLDFSGSSILKVSGGVVTTVAAIPAAGSAVAVDAAGNFYIADFNNQVVRKVTGGMVTTLAGAPEGLGDVGDNGPATSALLSNPTSMAVGPAGEVYIVDSNHNRVRKVVNGVITTFAGTGTMGHSGDNGPATSAQLRLPYGVVVDSVGNVYISDSYNGVIRKVNTAGIISTIAGGNNTFESCDVYNNHLGDGGPATSACFFLPQGMASDPAGDLYIADTNPFDRVRKVTNGMITTVAGTTVAGNPCGYNGNNIPAISAQLCFPSDVAVDSAGNLFVADQGNWYVRMVSGGVITTVAGNGGFSGLSNGPATSVSLSPTGIALDAAGNLYISDSGYSNNNRILKMSNGVITTVAGNGASAGSGDNGPAINAALRNPKGVATDALGRIFVADSGNNRIRVLTPPCSFTLTSSSIQATPDGGYFNIGVQTPAYCSWSVSGLPDWVIGAIPVSVTGPATIILLVAADSGASRSAIITVAGISVNVNQIVCTYAIGPGGQAFTMSGGAGTVTVTAPLGCAWSATNTIPFVSFTGASTGSGTGAVNFQVSANAGNYRSGTFAVAGLSFTVEQQSPTLPGLNFIGSMPHLAGEENWTTAFTLVNKSAATVQARMSLFGDALNPGGNGPLPLPLVFPQQTASSGPVLASSFDRTLGANASLIVNTAGPQTSPVLVGSAQLAATGTVDGFAIFHQIATTQEAVVPLETRNASSYLLAFDNTNGLVLGVALENISPQNAIIPVVIRNESGTVIGTPGAAISLGGYGHTSFVLSDPALGFPVTGDIRGTIEFDTPAGGQISVLGLRFTPPNNALTTIPALANVGTGGGSIAHLASGGDGWQTTFVLVNTGTSSAQATLSFFADVTGDPLSLPLTFPPGHFADTTAPSVTQTLAAGATLAIVSSGAPDLLTGSAQLSTTGHVSGFVIFRHNGQEAVVPLESRNASAYVLAFDNTNDTATGIAVNSVSTAQVNIPVVVRDEAGTKIAADTITMAPNGHYAFTLGTDRYPAALTIRGTIEFDKPPNAQIGALGIRIPSGAAHTYTTLPSLAK